MKTIYQNLRDTDKAVLRNFVASDAYIKKEKKIKLPLETRMLEGLYP